MKSALFVDFDNVYSGLRRLDTSYADRFARDPSRWMDWLIQSLGVPDHTPDGARRRVLVRRCYLNPQAYQRFRPSFNLAGFEIVDCPALTSEGKTSTDIHMVLDMIDLLQHEARYDEFIVFSADADFTPVLRKLRRWDRRTTVLAIGFPSSAYRASADLLIDQDDFVRNALGFDDEAEARPPTPAASAKEPEVAIKEALSIMKRAVADSGGSVPIAKLASLVLSQVDGIDASSWAGFGSFRALLDSRGLAPFEICWEEGGLVRDPTRLSDANISGLKSGTNPDEISKIVSEFVKSELKRAGQPIQCGALANLIIQSHPQLATDWNGAGTFRKFTETLDIRPAVFNWSESGGFLSDPKFAPRTNVRPTEDWNGARGLYPAAKQIHDVTGMPLLSPAKYQTLLGLIEADVAAHPFHLMETGKRVRDLCKEAGSPVSRADVNYVLRGLLLIGHSFEQGPNDPETLGRKLAQNVKTLCIREQMEMDAATEAAIDALLVGEPNVGADRAAVVQHEARLTADIY